MNLEKFIRNKLTAKSVYTIVMTILYVYLISRCIYEYSFGTGIYGCKSELLLMIAFSFIIYLSSFFDLDFFNKIKKRKKKSDSYRQLQKSSIYKAIFLSLTITTFIYLLITYEDIYIDFYNMIPNHEFLSIIGLAFLLFFLFFIVSYVITVSFFRLRVAKAK